MWLQRFWFHSYSVGSSVGHQSKPELPRSTTMSCAWQLLFYFFSLWVLFGSCFFLFGFWGFFGGWGFSCSFVLGFLVCLLVCLFVFENFAHIQSFPTGWILKWTHTRLCSQCVNLLFPTREHFILQKLTFLRKCCYRNCEGVSENCYSGKTGTDVKRAFSPFHLKIHISQAFICSADACLTAPLGHIVLS